ncbi:MAG: ShlB/FhaC/HecB family hemolysin secretion/activation protein [Sedimentisphaerales bacterium]|nr:ShlB/FhaC/HecB family hemolysin secretion/activation protein [Sedimentisphaerales bacterium]
MDGYNRIKWFYVLCCIVFCAVAGNVIGKSSDIVEPTKTEAQLKLEEKAKEEKKEKKRKTAAEISPEEIAKLTLPEDTSSLMTARQLRISGNTLLTTEELLSNIPLIYNASEMPLLKAESTNLYDFRGLCDIIENPGQPRQISARTIRGLTQCILAVYKNKGYSGIFVSVPPAALKGEQLKDEVLLINVTEAPVTSVTTSYFTPENEKVEKGYLNDSFLREWTPIKVGEVGKQKKLEDYVNLLNLNPDRYISARVSRGAEPNTLAVGYNVYEANPWHWFLQIDNAGTKDRRWAPRLGLINTNLLGIDDMLTVYHQAPWDSDFDEDYSVYGSYDFPLLGPDLRLNIFGGYSEFDVQGGGGIDFLGKGSLYGGELRYNVLQTQGWFFDVTTSLSHEESEVSSSIFSAILGSEVDMDIWGVGIDVHQRSDMSNTSVTFDRIESVGGSSQRRYWDGSTGARTNADRDFVIYTTAASHGQYLDPNKVQRLSGSVRWIVPTARLVPAKMTTFGGMYTVRGYKESKIITDGGVLASAQYEFDLVKHAQSMEEPKLAPEKKPFLRKLAPLAFFDYGRARIEEPVPGECDAEDLFSVGCGVLVELGDNFSGAVYYGHPLETTDDTEQNHGRIHASLMLRW